MGYIQIAVFLFQIIFRVWDAIKEKNEESKKQKTEALQSGLRGVIDRDPSRITASFSRLNDINRMPKN